MPPTGTLPTSKGPLASGIQGPERVRFLTLLIVAFLTNWQLTEGKGMPNSGEQIELRRADGRRTPRMLARAPMRRNTEHHFARMVF